MNYNVEVALAARNQNSAAIVCTLLLRAAGGFWQQCFAREEGIQLISEPGDAPLTSRRPLLP